MLHYVTNITINNNNNNNNIILYYYLVSRSFVRYVTELAALTADQQIKRDMQHMFGNPANTHS